LKRWATDSSGKRRPAGVDAHFRRHPSLGTDETPLGANAQEGFRDDWQENIPDSYANDRSENSPGIIHGFLLMRSTDLLPGWV